MFVLDVAFDFAGLAFNVQLDKYRFLYKYIFDKFNYKINLLL